VAGFELLEHTADVGVRARGASLEEVFEQATLGLAEVLGAWRPAARGARWVEVVPAEGGSGDLGGLLVDWLGEVLYLLEVRDAALAAVRVDRVAADGAEVVGSVALAGAGGAPLGGTPVKAVTYHRLRVERQAGGWLAEVYLDV
jgi:protein archease